MRRVRSAICPCLAAAAALIASPMPSAEPYPSKPVKIIVAFAPGGGNDFIARFVAQRLTAAIGQQFIVENKPGAGGSIGFEAGVKSQPDGYTLTLISPSYTTNPSLYKLKFDPVADITPIVQISQGPFIVVVNPSLPAKSIRELIALAKAKPGSINFASSGSGSALHLAGELFAIMAGIKLTHVPYKGAGPALTDTLAGQTNLMLATNATVMPHVRAGRLRALAVTTAQRLPVEPDIPTVAEAGVPGYEVIVWHGLIGPKGLPRPVVDRINSEVMTLLNSRETPEKLQNDGVFPAGGTPEQFGETIEKEIELWRKVVREAGVKPE
jgi:tripartite-type tricarboxylate transporter receptor subunit TctC